MTGHILYDPEGKEGSITLFGNCTERFLIFFSNGMTGICPLGSAFFMTL